MTISILLGICLYPCIIIYIHWKTSSSLLNITKTLNYKGMSLIRHSMKLTTMQLARPFLYYKCIIFNISSPKDRRSQPHTPLHYRQRSVTSHPDCTSDVHTWKPLASVHWKQVMPSLATSLQLASRRFWASELSMAETVRRESSYPRWASSRISPVK